MTAPSSPPHTLGERFAVARCLGVGGAGIVFEALDRETGDQVAVKTLRVPTPGSLARLKGEFRALARHSHPNLVPLYELIVKDGEALLVMERISGADLVSWVRHDDGAAGSFSETRSATQAAGALLQPLPPAASDSPRAVDGDRLTACLSQLADALEALHGGQQVHRDIKPANVLVTHEGRVVLVDFGLVASLDPVQGDADDLRRTMGTRRYIAPEVLAGLPAGPPSDWYAVGAMLVEVVLGEPPDPEPDLIALRLSLLRAGAANSLASLAVALLRGDPAKRAGLADVRRFLGADSPSPPEPVGPFVGRHRELAQLTRVVSDAAAGAMRVVDIVGPSGIGKSELVRRLLGSPAFAGAACLVSRCHPLEQVPFRAIDGAMDCLVRLLRTWEPGRIEEAVSAASWSALVRLFPSLGRIPAWTLHAPAPPGPDERQRAADALARVLRLVARERPVILWIDDAQWADDDSLKLLGAVVATPLPLAVIVCRTSDPTGGAALPLGAVTSSVPGARAVRLALGPLDPAEIGQLATELTGGAASRLDDAQGNPFLLRVALRSGAGDALALAADCSPDEQRVLDAVCAAGRPVEEALALAGAGLPRRRRPVLLALTNRQLLRFAAGTTLRLEPYHDRIRQAVTGALTSAASRSIHRRFIDALADNPSPDPGSMALHHEGAGELDAAATWCVRAADHAMERLAFARAARHYRRALELGAPDRSLHERLARALAGMGHGEEAARAFLRAADVPGSDFAGLRAEAADQLLRSGRFDEGWSLLRERLAGYGVQVPAGPGRSLAFAAWERARLVARGDALHSPRPRESGPLDAMWSAAARLTLVDAVLANGLIARHLRESLDAGDSLRAGRSLCLDAAWRACHGAERAREKAASLVRRGEELSLPHGAPFDRAWTALGRGTVAWFLGEWETALRETEVASAVLSTECPESHWELVTSRGFSMAALARLGRLRELGERLPGILSDALSRGDVYALSTQRTGIQAIHWLVMNEPGCLEEQAALVHRLWEGTRSPSMAFFVVVAQVEAALYAADGGRALAALDAHAPVLRRSGYQRLTSLAADLLALEARAATLASRQVRSRGLEARAAKAATRLARLPVRHAVPLARLCRAALARAGGEDDDAEATLAQAAVDLEALGMALHAAGARFAQGSLLGGDEGAALCNAAVAWARSEGVVAPERLLAAVV